MRWYLLAFAMLLLLGVVIQLHLYRTYDRAHEEMRQQVAQGILPLAQKQIDELKVEVAALRELVSQCESHRTSEVE